MKRTNLIGGAVLSVALCGLALTPARAQAAFSLGVGYSAPAPVYVAPAPVYTAPVASNGHYENRTQHILVSPEHREKRWVEPVYQTVNTRGYAETVMVSPGCWQNVCVPARYEDRVVQVWVPDTVVYSAPYAAPYYAPYYGPSVGVGFGFGFGGYRHWR